MIASESEQVPVKPERFTAASRRHAKDLMELEV